MKRKKEDIAFVDKFIRALNSVRNIYELKFFLKGMFTKIELKRVARRWELISLLVDGITQREIAKKLKVSLCNITRGSRELRIEPAFREIVLRLLKEQKKRSKK
jgi:TrpR family trp operon transcriptional repressor